MIVIEITSPHGRLYPCPKCNRSFRSLRALGGHKRAHTLRERKEAIDLARGLENPNDRRVRLGKAPISEPESDESDSNYGSDSASDSDMNKPRLNNDGRRSNSLVIHDNPHPNPNPNPKPSNGKGKGLLDVPNSSSTPKYSCPICDKVIRGASALWSHVNRNHRKNYVGRSNSPGFSSEVSGFDDGSDEEA